MRSTEQQSREQLEEIAATWIAKRDTGPWTEVDDAELTAWLAESTGHRAAYYRLNAAWQEAGRLQALLHTGPAELAERVIETFSDESDERAATTTYFREVLAGDPHPPTSWVPPSPLRGEGSTDRLRDPDEISSFQSSASDNPSLGTGEGRAPRSGKGEATRASAKVRYFSFAASLLMAIAIGTTLYLWPTGHSYHTEIGGLEAVPLPDGSKITLNTDSEIRVAVTDTERSILLEHGEAYFEVAKDPARPFVVRAGNKRVIAIGTKFSVRHDSDDTRVLVSEGRVRIEDATSRRRTSDNPSPGTGEGRAPRSGKGEVTGEGVILTAGTIARAKDDALLVEENRITEIERGLTWRRGQLTFRDTPLADAVAEFNRYNVRKIVIEDPSVGVLQVGGIFRATNIDPFVRLLEEAFPIHVTQSDDRIVLTAAGS